MGLADKLKKSKPQRVDLGKYSYTPGGVFDLVIASIFINILALAMPLTLLQVYDRIIPNSADGTLIMLIIGVGTALLLEACLRQGRSYVSGWMAARFEHLAGVAATERMLNVSIVEYERQGSGVHLERFNALGPLKELYGGQMILSLWDFPFALLFLFAIYFLAGQLVLVPIALIVLFVISALFVGRKLRGALEQRMMADDRRYSFIIEVLGGIHTVKGLAMEEQMIRRYERLQETCASADYNVALHSSSASATGALFSQLVLFCIVGYGATFVIDGVLTVGGLAACTMLAGRSMQPMQKLVGTWTRFQSIEIARERVEKIFAMKEEKPANLPELPPIRGDIVLDGLTFSYGKNKDGDDLPPLFNEVSVSIEQGETIGITGAGSSGKTTLLYLIMGILAPSGGRVLVDGNDLRDYQASSIARQIAYLPQDGVLFNGTILENITMFRDDKIDDGLDISRLLGLDSVVAHMPHGYDTPVGDGAGDKLPKGIKQRIAIARALVDKPRILLFDEANAAMDSAGDATLKNLLERLKGRVTLILVTPRPSMLNLSDRIFDIKDGRLVQRVTDDQTAGNFFAKA